MKKQYVKPKLINLTQEGKGTIDTDEGLAPSDVLMGQYANHLPVTVTPTGTRHQMAGSRKIHIVSDKSSCPVL